MSRHGLHKDSKVLLGGMVEPKVKAITLVTAAVWAKDGKALSQTDIIWEGISRLAIQAGVLDENGNVTDKYADAVMLAEASVIEVNRGNRGSRGGRRKGSVL